MPLRVTFICSPGEAHCFLCLLTLGPLFFTLSRGMCVRVRENSGCMEMWRILSVVRFLNDDFNVIGQIPFRSDKWKRADVTHAIR